MKNKYAKVILCALFVLSLAIIVRNFSQLKNEVAQEWESQLNSTTHANNASQSVKVFDDFTKDERKQIYKDIVTAEVKARKEAEAKYETDRFKDGYTEDNFYKKQELQMMLTEKYRDQVRTQYNIEKETEAKISGEANEENWPADFQY